MTITCTTAPGQRLVKDRMDVTGAEALVKLRTLVWNGNFDA
ncbi:hypothetical protein [Streptomyces monashensis]|nr:hypothetical protein [Streptomyces monashensis]